MPSGQVRPLERRKYMLKSLDQIETVTGGGGGGGGGGAGRLGFADREALAELADLRSMVELIKRMLTWESHERISPSAALRHPFVSMQQLRSAHEATRYYQLSLRGCRLSLQGPGRPAARRRPAAEAGEDPAAPPGVQRAIDQLDDLSLQEAGRALWGAAAAAAQPPGPAPILAFYGSRLAGRPRARRPPAGSRSDPSFSNLIRLSQASPEEDAPCRGGGGWAEGEHRGASAEPPAAPQRDGDGPDVKDMAVDAERPDSELFDHSSCAGEWLSEDWTLESMRGPRSQGLPPRHVHPHGQPRATSFLQHVGGHH